MTSIVFFGTGPVAAESLRSLINHFQIELVITKAPRAHHKGIAPVEELSRSADLPLKFANTKAELDQLFESATFKSPLGVIVDYGVIVSSKVINNFKFGIINSHFSLLPELRGADPITFAILGGQHTTGVSLMLIAPELDTGNLLAQEPLGIDPTDTTPSLTEKLVDLSNHMLNKYTPLYLDGQVKPYPQSSSEQATYSRRLTKSDGILDPQTKTADQLSHEIRAYLGFPKSKYTYGNIECTVLKAHAAPQPNTELDLKCTDGNYLVIDTLQPASRNLMTATEFLRGYAK